MKLFLEKLSRKIGFTPNEGKIVLVLVGAFLVGCILKYSGVTAHRGEKIDYSASDSEFIEKSNAIQQSLASRDSSTENPVLDTLSGSQRTIKKFKLPQSPIDINVATKDDLMALPGIGDAMAERIIMYRDDNGQFTSIDDLLNVKGIGKKKLEHITPYIKVHKQ